MSWNEFKNDVGAIYSFIKWTLIILAVVAIAWSLKTCTWKKYWDSGFY